MTEYTVPKILSQRGVHPQLRPNERKRVLESLLSCPRTPFGPGEGHVWLLNLAILLDAEEP
jgi:hypothetical protein